MKKISKTSFLVPENGTFRAEPVQLKGFSWLSFPVLKRLKSGLNRAKSG